MDGFKFTDELAGECYIMLLLTILLGVELNLFPGYILPRSPHQLPGESGSVIPRCAAGFAPSPTRVLWAHHYRRRSTVAESVAKKPSELS